MTPEKKRDQNLRAKYGISLDEYEQLLARQGGDCALCGLPEEENRHGVLWVDHDHETGEIRGLLCLWCNTAIGQLGDSAEGLERALEYLR